MIVYKHVGSFYSIGKVIFKLVNITEDQLDVRFRAYKAIMLHSNQKKNLT